MILRALLLTLLATPALACGGRDGGPAPALPLAELTAAEREAIEDRFAHEFREAARAGRDPDAMFMVARCELSGDAPPELLVLGRSSAHCTAAEAGGERICGLWVLSRTDAGWIEVLETAGRPRAAEGTSAGWRDMVVERGGPPETWKFDGAAYATETGSADTPFDPLGAFDAAIGVGPGGGTGVVWFDFGDPLPDPADAVFLAFASAAAQGPDGRLGALPDAFRVGLAALRATGPEVVVIQGVDGAFCGPDGCLHWLMDPDPDPAAPAEIGRLTGYDLQVAASGAEGWHDVILDTPRGPEVWRRAGDGYALSTP